MSRNAAEAKGGSLNNGNLPLRMGGKLRLSGRLLIPETIKHELEMVKHFNQEFKNRYCKTCMPAFKIDSLENIIRDSKYCPVREKKPIAVYLHHDNSSLSDLFCSEGLCSADVATYLNRNFVVWGWDLTSPKIKCRIRRPLSGYVSYSLTEKVLNLRDDQLPLMFTLAAVRTRRGVEFNVISYLNGTSNCCDILNCLMKTKEVFDDYLAIELQKVEESECKETAWSIPWKHVQQDEILDASKKKKDQESNLTLDLAKRTEELAKIVSDGNLDKLCAIPDRGAVLSVRVKTPYHEKLTMCLMSLAAYKGHTHLIDILLDFDLSAEGSGTTTWTPLILSARLERKMMTEALLSRGADPLKGDSEGAVALHHAAFHGRMQCVIPLCRVTPTTITDKSGRTPVHAACLRGHKRVIKYLIASGWKLNIVDKYGDTELHMSAWYGSLKVVKYLLHAKLNPHQKNNEGLTPLDLVLREGHHHIERWFMKRQGGFTLKLQHTQHLVNVQEEKEKNDYEEMKKFVRYKNIKGISEIVKISDVHLMDERGNTVLHFALEENNIEPLVVEKLLNVVHPHVLNYDGLTPLDLAYKKLTKNTIFYNSYKEAIRIMEEHRCPKEEGSPEELYKKLLTVICQGDNVKEVSRLLCTGVSLELLGDFPKSALHQAIINDRSKIVNLLLATQASLVPCTQGLNLLQHAWYSSNTTARVYCAITKAFSRQLKRERDKLSQYTNGLREDLAELIQVVDGSSPWESCWKVKNYKGEKSGDKKTVDMGVRWKACWQKESNSSKKNFKERSVNKLTSFMVMAIRAKCPLIASFLQRAGACSYFSPKGISPLHAALKAENPTLVETMLQNLGASLYIPDRKHNQGNREERKISEEIEDVRLPKDIIRKMDAAKLDQLEEEVYKREKIYLESLEIDTKDESEKKKVQMVLALQEELFAKYCCKASIVHPAGGSADHETAAYALLVASRSDLQQLLHLLFVVEHLPPDMVVDVTSGTTALHEAASHGKSGCVIQLLHFLDKAAAVNQHNVDEAKAFASTEHSMLWRLNRYNPLQSDKYGQTALHLAAMFGHKHTFELLAYCVGEDLPCRAGTTAQQIQNNFTGYLQRYLRYNNKYGKEFTPLDHHDPDALITKLLCGVDFDKLPQDAKRANVDMDSGEARQVKEAVLRAIGVILSRVAILDDMYCGQPRLVGSAQDGSKLFAPDEFDINIVIPAADQVSISVHQELDKEVLHKGHTLKITVETNNPHLQGNRLMADLFGAVKEVLADSVLDDNRLSIVPPSLTRTQVGVALALAWQGEEYPLLLVGVDLVPVLEVPWHEGILKPNALTLPDTNYMHISNTADGSWRCSFAFLEAGVLRQISPDERCLQLSCKMLLYFLKAERWMPREIKSFCTWWSGRSLKLPVPAGFCLKSSFFEFLVYKRFIGREMKEEDTIWWMVFVFRSMCSFEEKSKTLFQKKVFAYFGGECEGPKFGEGAPIITKYLSKRVLNRNFIKVTESKRHCKRCDYKGIIAKAEVCRSCEKELRCARL